MEWKGELVAVFRTEAVDEPVTMFLLDRSRMAWSKLGEVR